MQLEIYAVGRMKAGPERELYDRYADRIVKAGRQMHLAGPYLTELAESRARETNQRKNEEAAEILSRLDPGTKLVSLDEHGKDVSSQAFAEIIQAEQIEGVPTLAFAIGGPDGHGEEIKQRAYRSLRFGSLTWPHQMARVMLVEQIYRSITILSGHPYHRE